MTKTIYPAVNANPNFPEIETKILEKWAKEHTFEESVDFRKGAADFVFHDGPPFANGLPHYGHLLTGFIKDIFARYQTINGKRVERRFGWDCHGLPAEMGAEKELGISGKVAIEEYGIGKFNDYCRSSVQKYTKEWQSYVNRQARWVDFENDYKTMELPYMESVLWAFKSLYDKGLVYESMRVLPYSWACETPVSDFETKMDNSYREKASKALTVTFKLTSAVAQAIGEYKSYKLLVWTTTPWTLPSNLAIAVGKAIEYALVEHNDECLIIASDLVHKYEKEIGNNVVGKIAGSKLLGLSYEPLFPYFKNHPNAFKIFAGDFVTTEDGTGIVHMAPGFGEDDQILCKANNIELVCPVDNAGKFTSPIEEYKGLQVFEVDDEIIKRLKTENKWIKTEQYLHNYPHCWRTDTPLIYKAVPSWYVKVTAIKDKMIKNNQQINWIPGHIKDGLFGKWLENARDWSISRNRYWGCPIPIWASDDPKYPHMEVYGSIKELEDAFGVEVKDLHRPFIDTLVKTNPKDPSGKSMMRRVTDVLDCWFESGSMPYAQLHYPFENKEKFESHATADFIVEYVAQTRGWFYTLIVLSTALFDKPPFKNCICHGVLLGDGGQKLSKRLKNYADPTEVFNTLGADSMRWFMISSPVMRGQEVVIDKDAKGMKEAIRAAIKPLWNAYNFFTLYANADNMRGFLIESRSTNLLDNYIVSQCSETIENIKKSMDDFDTISACKAVEEFLEILNNWYIRRSRERFWKSEKDEDKQHAYNTLYSVLIWLCRTISPLMPLITEEIYLGLTATEHSVYKGTGPEEIDPVAKSIHLTTFPNENTDALFKDPWINKYMKNVRDACNAALFIRNEASIRIRQPLKSVTFIGLSDDPRLKEDNLQKQLQALVKDEINVKEWINLDKSEIEKYAHYKLAIKFPVVGKRLPTKVKDIIAAQKQNAWQLLNDRLQIAGEELLPEEYNLLLEPKAEFKGKIAPLKTNDALVMLDLNITEDLRLEGIARDLVRAVQQARKDAGFNITDRINVSFYVNDNDIQNAIAQWNAYIKEQTLAAAILNAKEDSFYNQEIEFDGKKVIVGVKKA